MERTVKQRKKVSLSSTDRKPIDNSNISKLDENGAPETSQFHSGRSILALCLVFRMVNALLVQTYFNPDEHWQALEVAHKITFGYGHLTWEWKKGIRSYLHPMIFVVLYKILAVLHLDKPWFMMKAPRLLQSIFSAVGDLYLYKLSNAVFGDDVAISALFCQLTNWFMFYCSPRTLSNSLETVLTLVGLYYWPCMRSSKLDWIHSRKWGLIVAATACAVRPTSAIVWLYVGLLELFHTRRKFKFVFQEVVPAGILVVGLTCLLDRAMYGSWEIVPLNFLKFNFLSSGGDYYGTHKWHWYFTQGFTVMLFTNLPFSIYGIIISKQWKFAGLIGWVLGLYSVLGHKEFRFVLPVLPIALMFSGYTIAAMRCPGTLGNKKKYLRTSSKSNGKHTAKLIMTIVFLLASNIPMALYMSLIHQRGAEDVMNHLAKEAHNGKVRSILFLMPCHSTPYYSTLHQDVPMRFLDCTPSEEIRGVPDESDRFMMDPVAFMSDYAKDWSLPSHIVLFESEEQLLGSFLSSHQYLEDERFFHSHFKVDRDLQASIVVYILREQ